MAENTGTTVGKKDELTAAYRRYHGALCACLPVSTGQKLYYLLLILPLLILLLVYRWDYFLFFITVYFMVIYAFAAVLRFGSALRSMGKHAEIHVTPEEMASIPDDELPFYTILVPLYHEEAVARKILPRLAALDYPKEKLDVRLLLEEDDDETAEALAKETIPPWCTVVTVPDGQPRTKPRACNYGLRDAKGEFLVIYDAEDAPEADQLRKVLYIFRKNPDKRLICVQAKLNFYNARQNLLTRLFTIEYSTNFDMQLPGLVKFRLPLPLGGTSNHFRTEELRTLQGWDPFNVTEDCDLGIRIYENGYHTTVVESTTWEEANPHLGNWLRQRSRWVKGFFQTHLVHYRSPLQTLKRLGFWGFFGCYSFVGASVLMMLANLLFWPVLLLYAILLTDAMLAGESFLSVVMGPHTEGTLYSGFHIGNWHIKAWPLFYSGPLEDPLLSHLSQVFFVLSIALFLMNFLLIYVHGAACWKRKFYYLIPYVLLMPFYWFLISLGAWKGVLQFLHKPFHWEKTRHGLDELPSKAEEETK